MKTIGIDARFWGEAGPGRYVKSVVKELEKIDTENTYFVFLMEKGYADYEPQNPNFVKIKANYKWYSFQEQFLYLFKLLKYNLDVLFVPHFNLPILYPGKLITAIPDLIMHRYNTNRSRFNINPFYWMKKIAYHVAFLVAVVRSEKIIVPTEVVKKDFKRFYKFLRWEKLIVVKEGVDPDFIENVPMSIFEGLAKEFGITQPYLLYVGSMYRHKNVLRLIDAFPKIMSYADQDLKLVIVGKNDYFSQQVFNRIEKLGIVGDVIMPGIKRYITDPEVISLRRNARMYVFPSLMEGFSLTPLEAQAVGTACAVSDIDCHREVYGNSVEYFDPKNTEEMAKKIAKTATDVNRLNQLKELGLENVKNYDWHKASQQIHEVIVA